MPGLFIRKTVEVDAPVEALWKVLTDAELIPQYMFGCLAETDWKPGSPLLWIGAADGKLYVQGHIVSIDAPRHLKYTTFDPNSTLADTPSNYLTMTYTLTPRGDRGSTLEMAMGDFATVGDGQRRHQETAAADDGLLTGIKTLAERR